MEFIAVLLISGLRQTIRRIIVFEYTDTKYVATLEIQRTNRNTARALGGVSPVRNKANTQKFLGHQVCFVLRRETNRAKFHWRVSNYKQKNHCGNPSEYLSRVVNFKREFASEMTWFSLLLLVSL
jgi:Zn-dependent M32 family carboxypeptidase